MKDFFKNQLSFMKGALKGGPGANLAGSAQAKFEDVFDTLYSDVLGPGAAIGGKIALAYGAIRGTSWLINNDFVGPSHRVLGGAAAGLLIGGLSTGYASKYLASHAIGEGMAHNAKILGMRLGTTAAGSLLGLGIGATVGAFGMGGLGIGVAGMAGMLALNKFGIDPSLPLRGAARAMGGSAGLLGAVAGAAHTVAGGVRSAVLGSELAARTILTGSPVDAVRGRGLVQGPLDAWFPFMRNTTTGKVGKDITDKLLFDKLVAGGKGIDEAEKLATIKAGARLADPRKFAINPRVTRRMVGIGALFAVGSAVHEAMQPMIAPPTAYFDGVNMRHVNDMGTGGGYGMGIMGRNSGLNINYQTAARMVAHAF